MAALDTALLGEVADEICHRGAVALSLPVLPPRRGKIPSHRVTGGAVSERREQDPDQNPVGWKRYMISFGYDRRGVPAAASVIRLCIKIALTSSPPQD